jgi:integrase
MDEQTFWQIIQQAHDASHGNMARKCELLTAKIAQLSKEDAVEFRNIFDAMMRRAYHWPLWAAAYLIHGGCGDDTFSDFRSAQISRGRRAFERALTTAQLSETGFHCCGHRHSTRGRGSQVQCSASLGVFPVVADWAPGLLA